MNIYIGNLAESITEESLRSMFETYGIVDSVKVIKDRISGLSRGFGFVTMQSEESGQAAIDGLNGSSVEGKVLRVNQAHMQQQDRPYRRPSSGGNRPWGNNSGGPRGGSRFNRDGGGRPGNNGGGFRNRG